MWERFLVSEEKGREKERDGRGWGEVERNEMRGEEREGREWYELG